LIRPSSTWLQFTVGHRGATLVVRSNQVMTSGPSTHRCRTTSSVVSSAIPRRPRMQLSASSAVPSGPLKVTSSASVERSASKSFSTQARK
jgi:hypothetical protein